MLESDHDITKIIPSKKVVNYNILEQSLSSKECFISAVKDLGCVKIPKFFPNIPDFGKARNIGVTSNQDYRDSQLTLPPELYNSQIYEKNLSLRGPLEDIIIENEKQRIRWGLGRNFIIGDGWSERFKERFEDLTYKIGPEESKLEYQNKKQEELPRDLQGRKLC